MIVDRINVVDGTIDGVIHALNTARNKYGNLVVEMECPNEWSGDIKSVVIWERKEISSITAILSND